MYKLFHAEIMQELKTYEIQEKGNLEEQKTAGSDPPHHAKHHSRSLL